MARILRLLFGLSSVLGALACSFIVDTDEIDEGCASGTKYCRGKCVDVNDATYGCSAVGCDPCEDDVLGNDIGDRFIPKCDGFQCVVKECTFGYGCPLCDKEILTDRRHCGFCGNDCGPGRSCALGTCVSDDGAGGAGGTPG